MCAVIVGLQTMTWACSSRVPPQGAPVARPPDPVPVPPSPVAAAPAPPAAPPVAAAVDPVPPSDECALIAEPGEPVTTVALGDRIDPSNAPRPSNDSERVLFRQLYETLVRVDCNGRVGPGLAATWQLDPGGRTWILTLRENARFSDGTAVTAADVRASWTLRDGGDQLRPDVSRFVESVALASDQALAITLRRPHVDAPLALAHPVLAIAKPVADAPWPLGTRSSRIAQEGRAPAGGAASVMTLVRDRLPAIRFLVAPGDPRDVLDQGADLLITRDPAALDYAATLSQFQSVPLAWQRIHVLLTPGRARSSPSLSEDQRRVLAADAVRGEAQGARGPFWWQMVPDCDVAPPAPARSSTSTRIVYDASDRAARDLAERLVGLAGGSGPAAAALLEVLLPDRPKRTFQRAAGLAGDTLARARRLGADASYVMALESRPVDPCRDLQVLLDGAPWLDPQTIVPLVETRLRAVVRRGRSGVTADWDGGVVLAGVSGTR